MRLSYSRGLSACGALVVSLLLCTSLSAQEATTQWSLWLGSHYTGLEDYTLRVAEFDRGEDGFAPEFRLDWKRLQGQNRLYLNGHYYDNKRMTLDLRGDYGGLLSGSVNYKSFNRRSQIDLLGNLIARESTNREGTAPGGKMLTNELLFDGTRTDVGYRRQELSADLELKMPFAKNLKVIASHRAIFQDGDEQVASISHCSSCHIQSRLMDVEKRTNTTAVGLEADLDRVQLSYTAQYRTFKSNVDPILAMYDPGAHPTIVDERAPGLAAEFSSRNSFSGEELPIGLYPETEKLTHTIKARATVGKGTLLGQFVNLTSENVNSPDESSVAFDGDRKITGNYANVKFAYPVMKTMKVVAGGHWGSFDNEALDIDVPTWRDGRAGGSLDVFDYTRYSVYSRTDMRGDLELIYQPSNRYRLSVEAGYKTRDREDYFGDGLNDKTTTTSLGGKVKYRPSSQWTGRLAYTFENIDNPFAPNKLMFERQGRTGVDSLGQENGAPQVYYYQRDALRYGDITSLPSMVNKGQLEVTYRPDAKWNVTAGISGQIGTNSDEPELDYSRTTYQPRLALNVMPSDKFSVFSSYSYLYQTQNGIAAVAMMDG